MKNKVVFTVTGEHEAHTYGDASLSFGEGDTYDLLHALQVYPYLEDGPVFQVRISARSGYHVEVALDLPGLRELAVEVLGLMSAHPLPGPRTEDSSPAAKKTVRRKKKTTPRQEKKEEL